METKEASERPFRDIEDVLLYIMVCKEEILNSRTKAVREVFIPWHVVKDKPVGGQSGTAKGAAVGEDEGIS